MLGQITVPSIDPTSAENELFDSCEICCLVEYASRRLQQSSLNPLRVMKMFVKGLRDAGNLEGAGLDWLSKH
jgi:hypothetical protein